MNSIFKHTLSRSSCLATLVLFVSILIAGCYRNDIRTELIEVPTLGSEQCTNFLEANLGRVRGVTNVAGDPYAKTMEVTFNARTMSLRNVEHHIARLGFDVDARPLEHEAEEGYRIPGNPKAKKKLPEECR